MTNQKARNYSILTIKRLYALSRNNCAYPGCEVIFLNSEDDSNYSNICHIEDANKNLYKSDRFNPKMTDSERKSFENLILLCPNHHTETNNTEKYTVNDLREMKKNHESQTVRNLSGQNLLVKYPSALNIVIGHIGIDFFNEELQIEPMTAPDPESKIQYNEVRKYKAIIEEYKIYQGRLSKIYDEIERIGSTKKELVLRNIKNLYIREKGKYDSFDGIKANADTIISNVESELWNLIENSKKSHIDIPIEAVEMSLLVILVDAFMRCSILEEPPAI